MTPEEYRAYLAKNQPKAEKRAKFGNQKTAIDGYTFDSKKESTRYLELKLWQQSGQIRELRIQPDFPLIVNEVECGSYVADFQYLKDGEMIVEDVKSKATKKLPLYRLKIKLMQAIYQIEVREI